MTAGEILKKHEDAREMHFHGIDRIWIIEAMEEYALEKQKTILSDFVDWRNIENPNWTKYIDPTDIEKYLNSKL